MPRCLLCNKHDADDSKDSIPVHRACWYTWLTSTHQGDTKGAVKSLHELQQKILLIHHKTLN